MLPAASVLAALSSGAPLPLREAPPALLCPLAGDAVAAGFPSPADDYVESRIDLNVELIPRPLSTFFMRVRGDAMHGDGIVDGDLLVIDRSITARPGMVVVATHAGSFILRRLSRRGSHLWLLASDGCSAPLPVACGPREGHDSGADVWGVVIHAVHHLPGACSRRR